MHKILAAFFAVIMISGVFMVLYAKDYRLKEDQFIYSAQVLRPRAKVYENPRITAKIIAQLNVGDWLTIVASYDRYYAFVHVNHPNKKYWILKEDVKVYKRALNQELLQNKPKRLNATQHHSTKNKPAQEISKPIDHHNKKHSFGFGLIHFRDIDKFSTHQWGGYFEYQKKLNQSLSALILSEFLYNELFYAFGGNAGLRYLIWSKQKSTISSSILMGGESLFANDRAVLGLNIHASLIDFTYQIKPSFKIHLKPLQLRMMPYNNQNIPVNYRYAFSLGVQF